MTEIDVSVVVPLHNEERFIERCLRALVSQQYPAGRFEIIVVDNNSTDRSVEIVKRYPEVTLLSEKVQGDFAARNRGLATARGRIVAFTDSDTAPFDDWLSKIVERMRRPAVSIVVGRNEYARDTRSLQMLADYEAARTSYILSSEIREIYFGYTCNMAVRGQVFQRLGPFQAIYRNSDLILVRRVVDEYGFQAVEYGPDVRVRRLEISSVWKYLKKQSQYARDFSRYSRFVTTRPLLAAERATVFRRYLRNQRSSYLKASWLFILLSLGAACYDISRWRGRAER